MAPRAVLVGLPGAGKSTTGRRLAKVLAVAFADSDDLVANTTGRDARAIFAADGEATFRAFEADVIAAALVDFDGVLALGGGALLTESTRTALVAAGVPVVWLRVAGDLLVQRVGDGSTRPLLHGDPADRLAALAAEREPIYRAVATLPVDCGARRPGELAAHIAARLHQLEIRS